MILSNTLLVSYSFLVIAPVFSTPAFSAPPDWARRLTAWTNFRIKWYLLRILVLSEETGALFFLQNLWLYFNGDK